MGVYIYTFRTENKKAQFNGEAVSVYASKYLCRLGDEDNGWNRPTKRGRLLRASMDRAGQLFDKINPKFIAGVHGKDWEGVTVYSNPTGAIWYDTDPMEGAPVGFLTKKGGSWQIVSVVKRENNPIFCGVTVKQVYLDRITNGERTQTNLYFVVDGKTLSPKAFGEWKAGVEAVWHEEYKAKELARQRDAEAAAAEHAAKMAVMDTQLAELDARVIELNRQRAALVGY
jgi:hypothetical protein